MELGDRRWDLEAHVQDLLLALKTDILGPLHHAREVSSRLDILTDAIVSGALLDERVLTPSKHLENGREVGEYIPLGPSLRLNRLFPVGMGLEQPSFLTLEAIIEKRIHQRICSLMKFFEL